MPVNGTVAPICFWQLKWSETDFCNKKIPILNPALHKARSRKSGRWICYFCCLNWQKIQPVSLRFWKNLHQSPKRKWVYCQVFSSFTHTFTRELASTVSILSQEEQSRVKQQANMIYIKTLFLTIDILEKYLWHCRVVPQRVIHHILHTCIYRLSYLSPFERIQNILHV